MARNKNNLIETENSMTLMIGIPREIAAGEKRVATVPDVVEKLIKLGFKVAVESGAGDAANFSVREDARRARQELGFLRMWSIHPAQIQPIVEAMRPDFAEVNEAATLLIAAQDAAWGPIQQEGKLHDRASYRYYWELLQRAQSTGMNIPPEAHQRFFS